MGFFCLECDSALIQLRTRERNVNSRTLISVRKSVTEPVPKSLKKVPRLAPSHPLDCGERMYSPGCFIGEYSFSSSCNHNAQMNFRISVVGVVLPRLSRINGRMKGMLLFCSVDEPFLCLAVCSFSERLSDLEISGFCGTVLFSKVSWQSSCCFHCARGILFLFFCQEKKNWTFRDFKLSPFSVAFCHSTHGWQCEPTTKERKKNLRILNEISIAGLQMFMHGNSDALHHSFAAHAPSSQNNSRLFCRTSFSEMYHPEKSRMKNVKLPILLSLRAFSRSVNTPETELESFLISRQWIWLLLPKMKFHEALGILRVYGGVKCYFRVRRIALLLSSLNAQCTYHWLFLVKRHVETFDYVFSLSSQKCSLDYQS